MGLDNHNFKLQLKISTYRETRREQDFTKYGHESFLSTTVKLFRPAAVRAPKMQHSILKQIHHMFHVM